jgi:hypothetical protein
MNNLNEFKHVEADRIERLEDRLSSLDYFMSCILSSLVTIQTCLEEKKGASHDE